MAGTIFGLANMFSGFAGTLSALLVGYLTDNQVSMLYANKGVDLVECDNKFR